MKEKWKGILFCFILALPSYFLGKKFPVIGGPVFGIILGIIVGTALTLPENLQPGILFTSKKILQYAVVLLGFGLNMKTVINVGATSLPIILATIATALVISAILVKALKIPKDIGILVGVGSSICGGSAIAATAPVIKAEDHDIAQAISVIFLFNILAALLFPTLGGILGFSNEGFALFAGTAVNDTSSVTAAASSWDAIYNTGTEVLDHATIVKLTRTLAIIPITLCLAYYESKRYHEEESITLKQVFPMFIAYFLLASILTTCVDHFLAGAVKENFLTFFNLMKSLSKFFIIMAMTAIGINTHLGKLIRSGGKPLIQGFCCWVSISVVSIILQKLLNVF